MRIHHFRWIVILASSSSLLLLNVRTGSAYDDSDFLRGWKNAKANSNRKGRSLDGIFQDSLQESGPTIQESDIIEESVITTSDEEVDVTPAIIGGTEVNPRRKYKFFVWLNGCGGSLVAPNLVLTRNECESKIQATLGLHKIKLDQGEADEFYHLEHIPIEKYKVHPRWDSTRPLAYDFVVLKLKWASQLYADQVVGLDSSNDSLELSEGDQLVTMGFGYYHVPYPTEPNVLQEVNVQYVLNDQCKTMFTESYDPDEIICTTAAPSGEYTLCTGDEGGPLIHIATMKQVGIANHVAPCGWLDNSYTPVFARVSSGYDFIRSMISAWGDSTAKPPNKYPGCSDKGGFYYDTIEHNCMSFEKDPQTDCLADGDTPHAGVTANMACCACGGGTWVTTPKPTSTLPPTTPKPTSTLPPTTPKPIVKSRDVDPPRKYKFFVWLDGCAGTLVAPNVVLSAARCERFAPTVVTLGMHKMFLGRGDDFSAIEHIPIELSKVHPKYNPATFEYDFWLIKLQWPTQLYADQVIGLDSDTDDVDLMGNEDLVTMGFGMAATGESYSPNVLQETTLKHIPSSDCIAPKTKYPSAKLFDSMLCLQSDGLMNACRGNLGAPLIHIAGNQKRKLVGIASWSLCPKDPREPYVYARVSKGYTYIKHMIRKWTNSTSNPPHTYPGCVDKGGFYDEDGVKYNCMWYEQGGHHCIWYGDYFVHATLTANEACCACGGGIEVATEQSTSETTTSLAPQSMSPNELLFEILEFQHSLESNITSVEKSCKDSALLNEGSSDITPSVVGGTVVNPPRKYKFFVWLGGCGGTLVAPNVVLSAAHCERVVSSFVTLGMHKKVLNKAAGDDADEFSQLELIPIEHSEIHPKYNPVTLDYDFWIIKLQWPSQLYADKAVTIDSPTDSFILSSGNNLSLIGFGRLKAGGSSPNMLHEVTLDYMTNSDCIARGAISPPLTDAMLCAGTTVGKGACHGDSGGPFIDPMTQKLVGVDSWVYNGACADYPTVFARVSKGYYFIKYFIRRWEDSTEEPPIAYPGCTDNGNFYDRGGVTYNCMWYQQAQHCTWYGDFYSHVGITANMACCACGGGTEEQEA